MHFGRLTTQPTASKKPIAVLQAMPEILHGLENCIYKTEYGTDSRFFLQNLFKNPSNLDLPTARSTVMAGGSKTIKTKLCTICVVIWDNSCLCCRNRTSSSFDWGI